VGDYGFTTFEPLVGQAFDFQHEGEVVEVVLASAEPGAMSIAGVPGGTLVFAGPREPLLPQMTYSVTHPDLGEFALFVVPVAQDGAATTYEAVFG